jgi:hypothetical protein
MVEDILLLRLWSEHLFVSQLVIVLLSDENKWNKTIGMTYLIEGKGAINLLVSDVLGNRNLPFLVIASDHHGSADAAFLVAQWPTRTRKGKK